MVSSARFFSVRSTLTATTTSLYMLRVWDRALTADEMWGAFQTAP